jgi:hypothetical protein
MQTSCRLICLVVSLLAVAATVGCRAHLTEYMVPEHRLTASSTQLTQEQMQQAVRLGCIVAGWNVVNEYAGKTLAQVVSGEHFVTVAISYSGTFFRIEHEQSSPGIRFDGYVVHHRYKFWVDRLHRHIIAEIAKFHGGGPA